MNLFTARALLIPVVCMGLAHPTLAAPKAEKGKVTELVIHDVITNAGRGHGIKMLRKSENGSRDNTRWTGSYHFTNAKGELRKFVADLYRHGAKTIRQNGGAIAKLPTFSGSADGTEIDDFTIDYKRQNWSGFLHVSSSRFSDTEGALTLVWFEYLRSDNGAATELLDADQADAGDEFERLRRAGSQLTSYYSLKTPFNPAELRSLADKARRDHGERTRLGMLILHAGIKKDESFKDLLQNRGLRNEKGVDLALAAYDYTMNRSEAALDHILAYLAAEDVGADSGAIVVLSTLDEWDRSIRAFRKHFVHTDGAGGECKLSFLATRAYLYPKEYAEIRTAIEAPMRWNEPLLSRKQ